jgi:hypothetical protein
MSGGLMQIVAQGDQDKYLTVDPEITFFKSMHRRHTNFAVESIEQTFNGSVSGGRVSATISRNGDLVHKMWLEFDLASDTADAPHKSVYDLIDKVTIEIGGTQVDRHYGEWMKMWHDLTVSEHKRQSLDKMVHGFSANKKLRVPLSFWFCKDAGQSLPLIALQYHEVKIVVDFTQEMLVGNNKCKLFVDYIYLDTDERQRFARSSHEYLIEQVQTSGMETIEAGDKKKVRLNFNHPVKELVFMTKNTNATTNHQRVNGVKSAKLQLNGHDRFSERDGDYFRLVQRYQHHTHGDGDEGTAVATENQNLNNIYVYSFSLKPEELQPSGTCNFSRIDNATLEVSTDAAVTMSHIVVYALNYNVLRIKNGMGGLAYSN